MYSTFMTCYRANKEKSKQTVSAITGNAERKYSIREN